MPGLHGRFLDSRLQPLIEVVQDTVGRHDAFLLACTAKYYDDTGYPGHANCSDNFNAVLQGEGLTPRSGWPAINFFFNTQVQECGAITSAEPWSGRGITCCCAP
ncbi:urea carboxylase-associated family protein [Acetobacter papayae]|uniref:urea carboxylase-associated family protein n=1 Tax=Acetobacter papayae TaxID=1076592 RepID=UPI000A635827|nr:urea carboxylase-associated family protein [Acetobacter papayae]